MPPSTDALLETHYTGLNILLALAHNASATGRSQETFVQQWDFFFFFSSGKINNYLMVHKNTQTDGCAHFFFFFLILLSRLETLRNNSLVGSMAKADVVFKRLAFVEVSRLPWFNRGVL